MVPTNQELLRKLGASFPSFEASLPWSDRWAKNSQHHHSSETLCSQRSQVVDDDQVIMVIMVIDDRNCEAMLHSSKRNGLLSDPLEPSPEVTNLHTTYSALFLVIDD